MLLFTSVEATLLLLPFLADDPSSDEFDPTLPATPMNEKTTMKVMGPYLPTHSAADSLYDDSSSTSSGRNSRNRGRRSSESVVEASSVAEATSRSVRRREKRKEGVRSVKIRWERRKEAKARGERRGRRELTRRTCLVVGPP